MNDSLGDASCLPDYANHKLDCVHNSSDYEHDLSDDEVVQYE